MWEVGNKNTGFKKRHKINIYHENDDRRRGCYCWQSHLPAEVVLPANSSRSPLSPSLVITTLCNIVYILLCRRKYKRHLENYVASNMLQRKTILSLCVSFITFCLLPTISIFLFFLLIFSLPSSYFTSYIPFSPFLPMLHIFLCNANGNWQ